MSTDVTEPATEDEIRSLVQARYDRPPGEDNAAVDGFDALEIEGYRACESLLLPVVKLARDLCACLDPTSPRYLRDGSKLFERAYKLGLWP